MMKKHQMVDALLRAGWPPARLPELEDGSFFHLKKLWTTAIKKQQRVDFATYVLGADEPQAKALVHWAGAAIDTLRAVSKRAGLDPTRRAELVRTSATILSGILAGADSGKEHPLQLAQRSVGLALALIVECEAQLLPRPGGKGDMDSATLSSG